MTEQTYTKELEEKVLTKLKKQLATDETFQRELDHLIFFYGRKLMSFVENEADKEFINNNFPDVVSSQYFQGYYTMSYLLGDDEMEFEDSDFSTFLGKTRNEIPILVKNIMNQENIDWSYTEIGHRFSMNVLESIQGAYEITKQLRLDIANYGAYKAFIEDERYQHKIPEDSLLLKLGNPFDIEFISPQVFMQCQFLNVDITEVWDLFMWSSVSEGNLAGSISLSQMNTDTNRYFLIEYKLSNLITYDERMDIVNFVNSKLSPEVLSLLQTRLYHTEDIDILAFKDNFKN